MPIFQTSIEKGANTMEIIFREAVKTDAAQYINLIETVWKDAYKDIFDADVFSEREKRINGRIESFENNYLNDKAKLCYVAETDGKIVGVLFGTLTSTYDHYKELNYSDLVILYVLPEHQRSGIASKFKNIFVDWLKQNGKDKFMIGVLKDNYKARYVYEKWGGVLDDFSQKFGNYGVDEVFYLYDNI